MLKLVQTEHEVLKEAEEILGTVSNSEFLEFYRETLRPVQLEPVKLFKWSFDRFRLQFYDNFMTAIIV